MGLICPCGTGSSVEELRPHKTASTGCSTLQQPTGQNGSKTSQDKSASAKKHLISKEGEAGLVQEVKDAPQSKGISCTPGEIQKKSHIVEKATQEKPRRSRSSSSHRERVNQDTERSKKHRRRHHSTDGKQEKKAILPANADEGHHKGYGGMEVPRNGGHKIDGDCHRTDRKMKHGKHSSKILDNNSDLKVSRDHREAKARRDHRHGPPKDVLETPDIIKGKKKLQHTDPRNRVRYMGTGDVSANMSLEAETLKPTEPLEQAETLHVPLENREKPFKEIGNRKHSKPRNKPPAYVIPIAAMLE